MKPLSLVSRSLFFITAVLTINICTIVTCYAKDTINTLTIAEQTIAALPQCLRYQITGLCFWQDWWGFVSTTLKVKHYIPDVVVTVYNQAPNTAEKSIGSDPWTEARLFYDNPAYKLGNYQNKAVTGFSIAGGQGSSGNEHNNNLHFKEVDVIGNPLVGILFGNDFLIPSQAYPLFPYYLSLTDALAWRFPPLEMVFEPQGDIPGFHEIGSWPAASWGPVYPRSGFVSQPNDAKDAAIVAFRAAHIVTRINQPHIYKAISENPSSCGKKCSSESITENDDSNTWQMISPIASTHCEKFGKNQTTEPAEWGSAAAQKSDGSYAFNMWRLYQGCIQGDGKYIGSLNF